MAFVLLSGVLLLILAAGRGAEDGGDEILFVQAIWRHGERTPEYIIPTDPANGVETWPNGLGQLTTKGMVEQFMLGNKLRRRYIDGLSLLSGIYHSGELYVRSSDSDRTLMSAASNMIGFYASDSAAAAAAGTLHAAERQRSSMPADGRRGGIRTVSDPINLYPMISGWPGAYVPVPIHTVARPTDQLPNLDEPCARREALNVLIERSVEFRRLVNKTQEFLNELSVNCGETVTLLNIWRIADLIYVELRANRTLPEWMTTQVRKRIDQIDRDVIALYYCVDGQPTIIDDSLASNLNVALEIMRLRGGPMLSELVDNFRRKADCLDAENTVRGQLTRRNCTQFNALKYYAYSMHDVTLRTLYMTLGLRNVSGMSPLMNPVYATAFTLELWRRRSSAEQIDDKYYIKLLYWPPERDVNVNASQLFDDITDQISGCDDNDHCTLTAFESRSMPYRPASDVNAMCADVASLGGALSNAAGLSSRSSTSILSATFTFFILARRILTHWRL